MLQARPHAIHFKRILDFGEGQVNPKSLRPNRELKAWIQRGLDFVLSQSPK
jgi:hypothetical protein